MIQPRARRLTRPTIEDKERVWEMTFDAVLRKMCEASGQKENELVKLDFVETAATVAASLVAGAEL